MAKTTKKEAITSSKDDKKDPKISIKSMRQYKVLFGTMLVLLAIALLLSFISFFIFIEPIIELSWRYNFYKIKLIQLLHFTKKTDNCCKMRSFKSQKKKKIHLIKFLFIRQT